jgi:hypothetical protein
VTNIASFSASQFQSRFQEIRLQMTRCCRAQCDLKGVQSHEIRIELDILFVSGGVREFVNFGSEMSGNLIGASRVSCSQKKRILRAPYAVVCFWSLTSSTGWKFLPSRRSLLWLVAALPPPPTLPPVTAHLQCKIVVITDTIDSFVRCSLEKTYSRCLNVFFQILPS